MADAEMHCGTVCVVYFSAILPKTMSHRCAVYGCNNDYDQQDR